MTNNLLLDDYSKQHAQKEVRMPVSFDSCAAKYSESEK